MDGFDKIETTDENPIHKTSASKVDQDDALGDEKLRLARIEDYEIESLHKDDSLVANLGRINAGLMRIAYRYEQAITRLAEKSGANILDIPQSEKHMSHLLALARQVDRFANFEARREETQIKAENAKSQRQRAAIRDPLRRNDLSI